MNRRVTAFIANEILRPPLIAIGFVFRGLYRLSYGWWGEKRYLAKSQRRLTEQIMKEFAFLFDERGAKLIPNDVTSHMPTGWSFVTLSCEGLLLRFVPWRDTRQVHVASERLPKQWQELSDVLNTIDPDDSHERSIVAFADAARILRKDWGVLKEAFSPERYPVIRQQLEQERRFGMAVTKMVENEINRRLYPDK